MPNRASRWKYNECHLGAMRKAKHKYLKLVELRVRAIITPYLTQRSVTRIETYIHYHNIEMKSSKSVENVVGFSPGFTQFGTTFHAILYVLLSRQEPPKHVKKSENVSFEGFRHGARNTMPKFLFEMRSN